MAASDGFSRDAVLPAQPPVRFFPIVIRHDRSAIGVAAEQIRT